MTKKNLYKNNIRNEINYIEIAKLVRLASKHNHNYIDHFCSVQTDVTCSSSTLPMSFLVLKCIPSTKLLKNQLLAKDEKNIKEQLCLLSHHLRETV